MNSSKSQNLFAEIKKYFKTVNQLNILLKETITACKETKILQKPTHLSGNLNIFSQKFTKNIKPNLDNIQLNKNDEDFIKCMKEKKITLVVLGQNVLAKALIVNELLSRYLIPFQINSNLADENWRFIRIKVNNILFILFLIFI